MATRRNRDRFILTAILVVGFVSAALIYASAVSAEANPLGDPEDSRQYLREMEVYGGTANVLASDLREWFDSLWHGKRLALTVVVLTVASAGAFRFVSVRRE